jgi:hypothetical protein
MPVPGCAAVKGRATWAAAEMPGKRRSITDMLLCPVPRSPPALLPRLPCPSWRPQQQRRRRHRRPSRSGRRKHRHRCCLQQAGQRREASSRLVPGASECGADAASGRQSWPGQGGWGSTEESKVTRQPCTVTFACRSPISPPGSEAQGRQHKSSTGQCSARAGHAVYLHTRRLSPAAASS